LHYIAYIVCEKEREREIEIETTIEAQSRETIICLIRQLATTIRRKRKPEVVNGSREWWEWWWQQVEQETSLAHSGTASTELPW
jgi:hypothetical protein